MIGRYLLVTAAVATAVYAAEPLYSAASIVNGANFAPGPVAPNSLATLFGTDLAWGVESLTEANTSSGNLPTALSDARLYVANSPAPLIYVSPTQINFLVVGNLRPGPVPVRVVRQGVTGPEVTLTLVEANPQFFQTPDGYVIAQHADYSMITSDNPAAPGEIIIVYVTGLGLTAPNPGPGEIPHYAAPMRLRNELTVSLGGTPLAPEQILYAGLSPGWAGLYQINIRLPDALGADPEIRAAVREQAGAPGLKLATAR